MLGLGTYLWRLLPANPILLRVVETGGKRWRDLLVRCGYLGLLVVFVLFAIASGERTGDIASLTRTSTRIFEQLSYLQLALVTLLAPIFTAGAITQEKDSQTYDILLATPLTSGQIVLGSLMSRLFFVITLLISGIPVFSITQIFGGVEIDDIVVSFGIAAATAFVTGALAIAIATFKVGTRRTIFSFYMLIVIYVVGLFLADQAAFARVDLVDTAGTLVANASATGWLTGLHPFLALRTVLDPNYAPPQLYELPQSLRWWPMSFYLTQPAAFFVSFMTLLSVVMVLPSILLLRRMAQSTMTFKGWLARRFAGRLTRARKPRVVWVNPIAWREARTKASAARSYLLRYGFIILGLGAVVVLVVLHTQEVRQPERYVTASSIDAAAGTVLVHGDTLYALRPTSRIYIGDDLVSPTTVNQRLEVTRLDTTLVDGTRTIINLTLAPIERVVPADMARQFLLGLVFLEFATILLIVTNAAASTVTREKEDGTLDLLLSTPITSRYYLWGKLRGLVAFVLPLVAVPVASVLIFVLYDLWTLLLGRDAGRWIVLPETLLVMPPMIVIVAAFAAVVGMSMSLRLRTTVKAVMASVGIVLGACGLLFFCGSVGLESDADALSIVFGGVSPFATLALLIWPDNYDTDLLVRGHTNLGLRITLVVTSILATAAYAAVVGGMYKSMVKNFDMTIRRQSR